MQRWILLLHGERGTLVAGLAQFVYEVTHEGSSDAAASVGLEDRYRERGRLVVDVTVFVGGALPAGTDDLTISLCDQSAVVRARAEAFEGGPALGVFVDDGARDYARVPLRHVNCLVEEALEQRVLGWRHMSNLVVHALEYSVGVLG